MFDVRTLRTSMHASFFLFCHLSKRSLSTVTYINKETSITRFKKNL
jgi:outer membrane murein-binding lipoprotein Lpp